MKHSKTLCKPRPECMTGSSMTAHASLCHLEIVQMAKNLINLHIPLNYLGYLEDSVSPKQLKDV